MRSQIFQKKNSRSFTPVFLAIVVLMNSALAHGAGNIVPNIRMGMASDKFTDTYELAAVFELEAPTFLHARRAEIAIGSISTSQESAAFMSFGPVWRLPAWNEKMFLDIGFSPTILSGSTFNGRDAGGNFHFTSSLSIGAKLGRNETGSIALRIQHMSNGGLNNTNPGLDMVGLEFSFGMSR